MLEALDNGSTQVDSIKSTQTVYFNYTDFKIENEHEYNQQAFAQELEKAWNLLVKKSKQSSHPTKFEEYQTEDIATRGTREIKKNCKRENKTTVQFKQTRYR